MNNFSSNLMPLINQVALQKKDCLSVFGSDYKTKDGTAERDFIHVIDLAIGHVRALESINKLDRFQILNLGTGKGTTVMELIRQFEKSNDVTIPYKIVGRRSGDIERSLANPEKAIKLLSFKCTKTLHDMCIDSWRWVKKIS